MGLGEPACISVGGVPLSGNSFVGYRCNSCLESTISPVLLPGTDLPPLHSHLWVPIDSLHIPTVGGTNACRVQVQVQGCCRPTILHRRSSGPGRIPVPGWMGATVTFYGPGLDAWSSGRNGLEFTGGTDTAWADSYLLHLGTPVPEGILQPPPFQYLWRYPSGPTPAWETTCVLMGDLLGLAPGGGPGFLLREAHLGPARAPPPTCILWNSVL